MAFGFTSLGGVASIGSVDAYCILLLCSGRVLEVDGLTQQSLVLVSMAELVLVLMGEESIEAISDRVLENTAMVSAGRR